MANDAGTTTVHRPSAKVIGFWQCWAFSVGTMIGSGIFMMPALLAPYGGLSFGGWLVTATGSITIALAIARLASRTTRSGGMQIYVQDTFGKLPGFLVGWSNWVACVISTAALSVGFVGYLNAVIPGLANEPGYQALLAVAVIWTVTLVLSRGVKEAGFVQLLLILLKLITRHSPSSARGRSRSSGAPSSSLLACRSTIWAVHAPPSQQRPDAAGADAPTPVVCPTNREHPP